jgi:thioredoxin reductase
MSDLVDALVIGAGPAGLSVALALARQLHTVAVFDSNTYRNDTAKFQHMVLTWDHREPSIYRAEARENILSRYQTVKIYDSMKIQTVRKTEKDIFEAIDSTGTVWKGNKLVLASGVEDIMPEIPGFKECWGIGM